MKWYYWIIIIVLVLIIVGFTTGFLSISISNKIDNNNLMQNKRFVSFKGLNKISCPTGCTLSTNTSGASSTVTEGNVTYTCRCSDGSTASPNLS